ARGQFLDDLGQVRLGFFKRNRFHPLYSLSSSHSGRSPMQKRCRAVRRKMCPPQTAGVAITPSPMSLVATTANFGPAFRTYVLPASLVAYNRSPTSTGEALKDPSSRSRQNSLPV